MTMPFDPVPAAEVLASAWRDASQMKELPAAVRPRTLSEGYDIQDHLVAILGADVAGWKLGVGSRNALLKAVAGRPLLGRVLAHECYRSGDVITIRNFAPATIEFEIAYVLSCDVKSDDLPSSPMDVVEHACVTFEVVQSRFEDRRAVGWPSFVADNAAFRALVVGEMVPLQALDSLADVVTVRVDGIDTARGNQGGDRTDAQASLGALLVHAKERGIALRKGAIVSTGAVSQPFETRADTAVVIADYGTGEIRMSVVRA
jgi:2-keto-4-pentenoate hydratase